MKRSVYKKLPKECDLSHVKTWPPSSVLNSFFFMILYLYFHLSAVSQNKYEKDTAQEFASTLAPFVVSTVVKDTGENLLLHTWVPHTDDVLAGLAF